MKVYLNTKIVDADNMGEILEPGFLFGWGAFETLRIYAGKPAFLTEHIKRLQQGCRKISLKIPRIDFAAKIQALLKQNRLSDAYCRITVFKKRSSVGVIIYVLPFTYYPPQDYQRGYKAVVSSFIRDSQNPLVRVKSISYMNNRLAWKIAQDKGKDEAIFLNEKGFLAEGSRTNIFFIKNNIIHTPCLDCGLLNGITRQKVVGLIKRKGLKFKEGKFRLRHLLSAQEAFLTSSLMEIMPLIEVDGEPIHTAKPGAMTIKLHQSYKKLILA